MNLLFVHDHKFRRINGEYYSTGGLDNDALVRYTDVFDTVKIVARVLDEQNMEAKYSKITDKKIEIFDIKKIGNSGMGELVESADCIISRLPSFLGLKVLNLNKKYKKPYMIEMVGCPWDSLWNYDIRGKMIAPYITLRNKAEVKRAPYVLYVTNEFLQKRYPATGVTVNCSNVTLTEFDDRVLENRLVKIGRSPEKLVIGTTAAVNVRFKGQQYVIEALGKLKNKGITNIEYQLVGNGDQTYLKEMAEKFDVSEQVNFIGGLPHDGVFKWLETIDGYVQPSKQEGLPRALIEAMSRAVPAFGANTAGIPELLDKEFIFSNGKNEVDEICAIIQNLSNVEVMKKQALRNYDESKKYDRTVIEERRNKFINEFVAFSKKANLK